ncbi:MAG: diacylglycerol kinase family protein [Solirubrobacterales bacterium]
MSEHRRRLAIIMNPTSAGGKPLRVLGDVEAELAQLGLPHRVIESRDIEHGGELAREAAAAGEVVVALGGDGLVGALAGALRGEGVMGVLPAGRGNDFARALGIPGDVREACRVLATGVERALDLGEANGRPFACIASVGYDSVANRIANQTRFMRGNLVYAYAAIRALASWKAATFTVTLDGAEQSFRGYNVVVANSAYYGGGMKVAPSADPSDGLLDVIFVRDVPKRRFIANLPKVFSGKHVHSEEIVMHRARVIEIAADRPFDVYADGDPLTQLPARVTVLPKRLRLIAPAP